MTLAEPYPSPPGKPGEYCLYLSRHRDDDTQTMAVIFAAPYAARKFLDELLQDDGYVWENECTIRSETGIVVSTRWWPGRLRACVEHEYSLPEMAWTLQGPQLGWARYFRFGPPQPRTVEEATGVAESQRKRPKREGSSTPRADTPPGYVHVSDVALSMGIDAKQARVALRKLFPDGKPAYGWYFDPKTLDDLKTRIKGVVK